MGELGDSEIKKKSREKGMANRIFKMASLSCHKLGKDVRSVEVSRQFKC